MARIAAIMSRPNSQCPMRTAFAAGLQRRGWQVVWFPSGAAVPPAELLVTWGTRAGQRHFKQQLARNGKIIVLERAYVGNRFEWTSVSFGGGLNRRGRYVVPDDGGDRWRKYHADVMQPWRAEGGEYALLMGQMPGDMSLQTCPNILQWYQDAKRAIRRGGHNVKFRPHPGLQPGAQPMHHVPLSADLSQAIYSVSYNSNSSVESVLSGVPTVVVDEGAMAWEVAGHEVGKMPPKPDRTAWSHWLAWTQYLPDEMASGYCAEAIGL